MRFYPFEVVGLIVFIGFVEFACLLNPQQEAAQV